MSLAFGIALYIMIWWLTLFAVLPFGVRTQDEEGEVVPGTPASAPARPRLIKTFLINTVVAAIAFTLVWGTLEYDWLGLRISLPQPPPTL